MATTDTRANVYEILKDYSTAMVVTHGLDGHHGARPMHVAEVDERSGQVYFLTGHGRMAEEIQKEPAILLVFQNEGSSYLSLSGNARLEHDSATVKRLWKEPYKVWFPKGAEDPEIAVITVDLAGAEYWDNRGLNKLEYLFEATKAYVKGEKPTVREGDQHAKTSL